MFILFLVFIVVLSWLSSLWIYRDFLEVSYHIVIAIFPVCGCMRDNIFAWHIRNASTIDSPPVYSSFSMLSYMTRTMWLPDPGWAASPRKTVATAFEVMLQVTTTGVCLHCGLQFSAGTVEGVWKRGVNRACLDYLTGWSMMVTSSASAIMIFKNLCINRECSLLSHVSNCGLRLNAIIQ